jgi:hypothetical protein
MTAKKTALEVEISETSKIAKSIKHVARHPRTSTQAWRRALYHALLAAGCGSYAEVKAIREALDLP